MRIEDDPLVRVAPASPVKPLRLWTLHSLRASDRMLVESVIVKMRKLKTRTLEIVTVR